MKASSENFVSVENLDEIKVTLKQHIKSKGKLHKGPNWTAFNRENLGTIPRNIENILIKEKYPCSKGFLSNTKRFNDRSQSVKYNYPGPGTYSYRHKPGMSIYSSKGFGVGFLSEGIRFNEDQDFYNKFKPGPGEYRDTNFLSEQISRDLLFKSLYNTNKEQSLKAKENNPGPGYYNINCKELKTEFSSQNILQTQSNLHLSQHFFKSKTQRFDHNKSKKEGPGPGQYFADGLLKQTEIQNNKELVYRITNISDACEIQNTRSEPNEYYTLSHFFKDKRKKNESPEKKFNIGSINESSNPGPGSYNLTGTFDKTKINIETPQQKYFLFQKTMFNKRIKTKPIKKKIHNPEFYEIGSGFDLSKKKQSNSIFKSKSPRQKNIDNKNPGPCYYSPKIIKPKISHNVNTDKLWI